MSTDRTSGSTPRASRRLRALLFTSLAVNVAVAGLAAGAFLLRPDHDRPPPRGRDYVFLYTDAFDDAQREALGQSLRARFNRESGGPQGAVRQGPGQMLTPYREALGVLRAETFDEAAFARILRSQNARAERRQAAGEEMLTDFMATLGPAERSAYADRLEKRVDRLAGRIQSFRERHRHD